MTTATKRECGTCSLCCKLFYIRTLNKPLDTWCQHCKPGKGGCSIYASRPAECADFECGWLADKKLGDEWFPARCKMVLSQTQNGRPLVTVDPAYPNAWRREPYHSQLKVLSQKGVPIQIRIGRRCIDFKTEEEVTWIEGRPENSTEAAPA